MPTFDVIEKQGLKMIKATIQNETVRAEAGALHYMLGDIVLEAKMPSAGGFIKSLVTSESVFKPTYTGSGTIFFGPPTFNEYHTIDLQNEAWVLDKGAFVCAEESITLGAYRNKALSGLFSGEGFFQLKIEGTGKVVIQAQGPVEEIDLNNDTLTVDGSFAVARQAHLDFSVKKATKGLLSSAASGEGFVNVIKGTGKVMIAPVPTIYTNLVNEIAGPLAASKSQ